MIAADISLYVWSDGLDCRGHKKIGMAPAHTSAATELIATKVSAGSERRIFTEDIQRRASRVDRMMEAVRKRFLMQNLLRRCCRGKA
jgi:hypothetical protein